MEKQNFWKTLIDRVLSSKPLEKIENILDKSKTNVDDTLKTSYIYIFVAAVVLILINNNTKKTK